MIDLPNFVRIGPNTALLVCFHCTVLPAAFQKFVYHIKEFVRNLVSFIMLNAFLEAKGLGGTF